MVAINKSVLSKLDTSIAQLQDALSKELWSEAMHACHQYLQHFPCFSQPDKNDADSITYFRSFAEGMIQLNHTYDSVITLLSMKEVMAEFVSGYFSVKDKKGVQLPNPVAMEEDTRLVSHFCIALHHLLLARMDADSAVANAPFN